MFTKKTLGSKNPKAVTVGILAFQGNVAEHAEILKQMKQEYTEVRSIHDLAKVTHLIIPGGESTVMSRFLTLTGLGREITLRVREENLAVMGTCAGAILLCRRVSGKNAPRTLGLMDITVDRNAYGSQINSFETSLKMKGSTKRVRVAFIRAPKILSVGHSVEVLSEEEKQPAIVRQGRLIATTCHPEMRGEKKLHELFVTL